jgi:chemotaxis protein methyltransferase CheR
MRYYAEVLNLPDNIFLLLRDLIHEHTGMFFDNDKRDLMADKLSPLVLDRGFNSALDYYYLLKYDKNAEKEWERVINALAVQETFFWREMDQIHTLVNVLMPSFFSKDHTETLKIWCAACSTGEEPLTIAMALNEAGWFERAPICIYASDASTFAVKKAISGLYRERSFRTLPDNLREKYFIQEQGMWRVSPDLQEKVRWSIANLMTESDLFFLANARVIFCRNVFIYFSQDKIRKTVKFFAKYMPTPGYLCVSASESLLKLSSDFELQEIGGAIVYVKS